MNIHTENTLVAPSDIATIAQVSRAAVSNWRRREGLNFPAPAGGTASRPLFNKQEVIAWLQAQGKDVTDADSAEHTVWELMNAARGSLHPEETLDTLYALASLRVLSVTVGDGGWASVVADPTSETVMRAVASLSETVRDVAEIDDHVTKGFEKHLPAAVRVIDSLEQADIARAFDYALDRQSTADLHRSAGYGVVSSPAAEMLSTLADQYAPADGTLYDPAAGISSVLISALSSAPDRRAVGIEINAMVARRARQRAVLRGLGERLTIHTQDVLQKDAAPELRADVAVAEGPAGIRAEVAPMDSRWPAVISPSVSEFGFVFDAIAHLKPNGRGFVIMRAGIGTNSSARKLRAALLERGHIETIIALPQRSVQWTQLPFQLWVLAPAGTADEVTFIDATTDITPAEVVSQIGRWTAGDDVSVPHTRVGVSTILADNATFAPNAWIEYSGDEDAAELYATAQEQASVVATGAERLNVMSQDLELPALPDAVRVISIKELIKLGWVEKVRSARVNRASQADAENVITHAALREGTIADLPRDDEPGLTLPGDVLVGVRGSRGEAVTDVDTVGGHLIGTGIIGLRVKQPEYVDPRYLAIALTGTWNERHVKSSGPFPTPQVDHMDIPVPVLDVQRDIVTLHEKIAAIKREAAQLTASADAALQGLLQSVRQAH